MPKISLAKACKITGMSAQHLTELIESGEMDIGEIVQKPGKRYRTFIIWSDKLAKEMGMPEEKMMEALGK